MLHSSSILISKSALQKNIDFIKKIIGKDVIFSSVIKGNAYGHSIEIFVPLAEACGINHFSVFSAAEAVRVKKLAGKKTKILIMGFVDNSELEWAVKNDIEFFVFDLTRLNESIKAAKKLKKKAKIHIEVETGLNRTGFDTDELAEAIKIINENLSYLSIEGLCTHYAGAESVANYLRIQKQIKKFNKIYKFLLSKGIKPKLKHTACSAAAMTYPETRMDMVRIGIIQYGYWPSKETFIHFLNSQMNKVDPLRRIISWKSIVMSLKKVLTGEFVGYGTTYLAHKDMIIAVIPVGYAYGFSRSLSNQGRVLIKGQRVGVVGMVNMNLLIADVTDVEEIKKGDEVVMIGDQENLSISVASFSELSNQLNYELLTRLPESIPRIVVE
jgi:alanine racemase